MPTKDQSLTFTSSCRGFRKFPPFPDQDSTTTRSRTLTRTRTGTRVPKWHDKIVNGQNATSAMQATWDSGSSDKRFWSASYIMSDNQGPGNTYASGDICMNDIDISRVCKAPQMDPTKADNGARAKFYKALRKTAVQFSGPTFLGELRETIHMLRRPAAALYDSSRGYLSSLAREKRRNPKHWTKVISGLWLEHSFGWVPLIADVKDAYHAYQNMMNAVRVSKVSGSFQDFADYTSTLDSLDNNYSGARRAIGSCQLNARRRCFHTEETVVRYRGALKARTNSTARQSDTFYSTFGFTPSEFIPAAWELLPWSFLVDYFTNIGDILTSAVTSTADIVYVNKTERHETHYFGMMFPVNDLVAQNVGIKTVTGFSGDPAKFDLKRRTVARSIGNSIPLPTFQLNLGLGDGQLLNIAALLGQSRGLHPQDRFSHTYTGYRRGR